MPGFISPQLATLKMKAPSGAHWIHEVKYDGYRIQLHIDRDDRKAFSRNGHNWVNRFSVIAGAFDMPGQAIVDGEHHEGDGQALFEAASKLNYEGIISKRVD